MVPTVVLEPPMTVITVVNIIPVIIVILPANTAAMVLMATITLACVTTPVDAHPGNLITADLLEASSLPPSSVLFSLYSLFQLLSSA